MKIRKLTDVKNLKNKRVLVRVDFNVPVKDGKVKDLYKIEKSLPTIKYLLSKGAQVVVISHLGRPKGLDKSLSLEPVAEELAQMIYPTPVSLTYLEFDSVERDQQVKKFDDVGSVALLENIRFYPEEEKNDKKFAKQLSQLADIFVLDGFAVAHRDAASVSGVAKYLPTYAGLLLAAEIEGLSKVTEKPKRPLVAIIGGVKMETKIPVIKQLLKKADYILVGGGIANTYLWAKGQKIGASRVDKDFKKEILQICANKKVVLPLDVVVGKHDGSGARIISCSGDNSYRLTKKILGKMGFLSLSQYLKIFDDEAIYDIGPKTVQLFAKYIKQANTLVWNGALGYFEQPPYQHGTFAVARLFAARSKGIAFGVSGGGETVQILQKLGIIDDVDLVSTGGGAMLEYLSGKKLPGVKAVSK